MTGLIIDPNQPADLVILLAMMFVVIIAMIVD